eukprot:2206512-Rhodomonas_salina.2
MSSACKRYPLSPTPLALVLDRECPRLKERVLRAGGACMDEAAAHEVRPSSLRVSALRCSVLMVMLAVLLAEH